MATDPQPARNGPAKEAQRAFGERLRELLRRGMRASGELQRWKQEEFAERMGVSSRTLTNWISGASLPPSLDRLKAVLFGDDHPEWPAFRDAYHAAAGGAAVVEVPPRPPRSATPVAPPTPYFLGRDDDVADVLAKLAGAAVLVQGPPGIGKSELTRAVARDAAGFAPERRWFVGLQTARTAAEVWAAVALALGLEPSQPAASVLAHLKRAPGLLVLDNLETPWSADREPTEAALAELAGAARVLASFRGRAPVGGPVWAVHVVEPLAAPFDAQLFRAEAGADFSADPAYADLLAALGGVPLALRLIARRAFGRSSLAGLWAEWRKKGAAAARQGAGQHKLDSLEVCLEISLEAPEMTPAADLLFRRLGALPAGMARADREVLGGDDVFDAEEALLRLGLAFERGDRLDLLAPIREYARVRRPPEAGDAWRGHYLELARRGERLGFADGLGVMARLAPEFANLAAALTTSLPERWEEALTAVEGFGRFAYLAGRPAPALDDVLAACRAAGSAAGAAACLRWIGNIALARSDHAGARAAYEAAMTLYREIGGKAGEAHCVEWLGDIALRRSDHAGARAAYKAALLLYREIGSKLGEANCVKSLGDIALRRSDHAGAWAAYEAALPLYREIGDKLGEANCVRRLGDIALARSDHAGARAAYEAALPLYREIGSKLGEANCVQSLGDIALRRSDHAGARAAYEAALPLYREIGDKLGEANCIKGLGDIALRRSDHAGARAAYEAALPLYREIGAKLGEANCVTSLGDIALRRSDHAGAREAYEAALPLYREIGDKLGEAGCIFSLGDIALAKGDLDAAGAEYARALPMYVEVGNLLGEGNTHFGLGDVARARGDAEGARRAYETALECYRRFGDHVSIGLVERRLAGLAGG